MGGGLCGGVGGLCGGVGALCRTLLLASESAVLCLPRRLSQRPTAEELKQRNILQGEAEPLRP